MRFLMFYHYTIPFVIALSLAQVSNAKQPLKEDFFDWMEDVKHNVQHTIGFAPKSDVQELEREFIIKIAVPGLTKEDLSIVIDYPDSENATVIVKSEMKKEEIKKDEGMSYRSHSVSQESFV